MIYDLDTKQCEVTSDCQALGGVFAELECIENICATPSGCTTNAECLNADNGDGSPIVCIERNCVPLLSAECPKVLPVGAGGDEWFNMLQDDPLILAATGGANQSTDPILLNYELALGELEETTGGIGPNASTKVIMLACDGSADDDALDREMDHLVNKLKVPGIATQLDAEALQRAFNDYGGVPDVQPFFLSALDSDPVLETNFIDDNRVWSLLPSASVVARTYPPLLTQVITHLALPANEVRVAVVQATGVRFFTNSMTALTQSPENYGLYFNGVGVDANAAAEKYLAVTVGAQQQVPQATIDTLIEFKPHVVVSVGWGEFVDFVIPGIEAGWDAANAGQARPFYILSPYNYNDGVFNAQVAQNQNLRVRLAGVNAAAAADPAIYNDYTSAWDRRFAADDLDGERGYENYYDAAYYMIYAAAAAGGRVTTGDQLALGMGRLLSGTAVPVGAADLLNGFTALSLPRNNISLVGTMGPPDFDPLTGTRGGGGSVWCLDAAGVIQSDVLRYVSPTDPADAKTASLSGAMPTACFPTW